ncbi:MAG: antitoxin [Micropruina sp.]|uniref:type II toxin-antitoxin system VapB family antitoxin n=1 Tax=Micropruina sp. TaxID=2737536 RepID=UPI0039E45A66
MTNVLIRGLSDAAVERIDAEAFALGLSRNEFLRRKLEVATAASAEARLTADDWARSSTTFSDLADPDVMDAAWQ